MGEVNATSDAAFNGGDNSDRVHDWETGLPNLSDITPLSHGLIPRGLLSAFNIKPEPYRTAVDVANASEKTMLSIRGSAKAVEVVDDDVADGDGDAEGDGDVDEMSEAKKPRRNVSPEDADSAAAVKPTRLVWTPQLHKRFVDVVAHLGIKNSVPKTIMQLMNVEGLTRDNVASHLQKYRLYLKRYQGIGFDSSPVESSGTVPMNPVQVPVQMNYNHQQQPQPQMNNYNNQYNHAHAHNNYGVMQTGNSSYNNNNTNNQYNAYASYHHLNHNNYPHQVTPGDN